jgi:acetyl coenzyme A synthetase (ADP forming)-like protein
VTVAAHRTADASYPAHREVDVTLRDGSTVRVRPIRDEDERGMLEFFSGLSLESRAFRFFSAGVDLEELARWAADVDYENRFGLLALRGAEGRIVGHGSYVRAKGAKAEIALAIADELQGEGLGTILVAHLAEAAHEHGIELFEAEVLAGNHRMIEVFRESGFPVATSSAPGSIHVEFPTSFSADARERFERREQIAAAAAVTAFLEPRAIAVVGASRERGTIGGEVFHNLIDSGFDGAVYPVNPNAESVQSVAAYPSIETIPGHVELAVIAVPSAVVAAVARECAHKGVGSLIVISSGFAEVGDEGAARQRELVKICRGAGMRLIGPNCLGVLNMGSQASMNATFAPGRPPRGTVGFLSQSGALGLALIDLASDRGLGLSSFASIGNRADITGNDFLEYWEQDDDTDVALLYIESFSDPHRFSRVARRVGAHKPIVVVKSGRSKAGARATSSHTGALLAASDVTVDALFDQSGVIRADSLADLLDVTSLLASQPLPRGRRVGILTNAGGPGIMCADACEAAGLEVPAAPAAVRDELRGFLAAEASLGNPVDMIATATAEQFRRAIAVLAAWEEIDALIVIFVRPLLTRAQDVAHEIRAALRDLPRELPVQAVFMSAQDHATVVSEGGVPAYLFPEDAARALARVEHHAAWRRKPSEPAFSLEGARTDEAAAVIADALASGPGWLDFERLTALLGCYEIPFAEWHLANDPIGAGLAAAELGGSVALKAVAPGLVHKTDAGAVVTGLRGEREVVGAAAMMDAALSRAGYERERFLVQRMVSAGVEMLVGVVADAVFGPVLACGAGGIQAELTRDVAVRLAPIAQRDAAEMIRSLGIFPLLTGYRGSQPVDLAGLEALVLRVSALVDSHPEIAELDLNPVIASADGAVVVDARARIEAMAPARSWPAAYGGAGA